MSQNKAVTWPSWIIKDADGVELGRCLAGTEAKAKESVLGLSGQSSWPEGWVIEREVVAGQKVCPKCGSTNVEMFHPDQDWCRDCKHQWDV